MKSKSWLVLGFLGLVGILTWFFSLRLLQPAFLTFSDAAKFADLARNLVSGRGFGASFAPFQKEFLGIGGLLPTAIPPLFPILIAAGFKIFGVNDWIVLSASGVFYLLSAITLFYLGKKVFSEVVGLLTALVFIFDPAMLNYATSGASESLFVFEIILAALLIYQNTKVSRFLSFLVFLLMYFTRPSAIIFITAFILLVIFLRFKSKTQILKAGGLAVFVWLAIEAVLIRLQGRFLLYSPITSFLRGTTSFSPLAASTASLRGGGTNLVWGVKPFLSKFFYNLYNFYKFLPNILSPYLAGFYLLSLFRWEKERDKRIFRLIVLFLVVATFITSAAFLPIYRYLHPIIPLVYLLAVEMLVWVLGKIFKGKKMICLAAIALILIFIVGQTAGKIFLDSRYLRAHTNPNKPPVYVQLAEVLKENTDPDDLIITNLDTWGSWYGERKTIWFPLEPSQLIPEEGKESKIDAIYLTSYKMDDENYYMGEEWRKFFLSPEELKDPFFVENFEFAGEFNIQARETYEREGARAILLKKKE